MADRKLGRGLEALRHLADPAPAAPPSSEETAPTAAEAPAASVRDTPRAAAGARTVPLAQIEPNPHQPRRAMDPEELEQLRGSIEAHGMLQPVVVRPRGDHYQLVAGERRFRAAELLGMDAVPAIIRDVPDEQMLELALIENLQRADLNAIEKAESFRAYLASTGQTQEEAAGRLGLDRSTLANIVRLLELPGEVQQLVRRGAVGMGHARAILGLRDPKKQLALAARVVREGLSVRQVEQSVAGSGPKRRGPTREKGPEVRALEARLREALGLKVTVEPGKRHGTGRIVLHFYGHDDLERVLARLE